MNSAKCAVSQSAEGERLFQVRDHGYAADDPRFRGPTSRKRLSFHTDRCDVIAFACLHQAEDGGDNFIVSSVALYEELRTRQPDVLKRLCQPLPYLRHTVDTGNALPYCLLPVFSEREGHFAAHFLRVLIDRADQAPDAPTLTPLQRPTQFEGKETLTAAEAAEFEASERRRQIWGANCVRNDIIGKPLSDFGPARAVRVCRPDVYLPYRCHRSWAKYSSSLSSS